MFQTVSLCIPGIPVNHTSTLCCNHSKHLFQYLSRPCIREAPMSFKIQLNPLTSTDGIMSSDLEEAVASQNATNVISKTETGQTLRQQLYKDWNSWIFLAVSANYWPESNNLVDLLHKSYYLIARFVIVASSTIAFIYTITSMINSTGLAEIVDIAIDFTLFAGFVSVIPAQYKNQIRMNKQLDSHDLLGFDESVRVSTRFGMVAGAFILTSFTIFCVSDVETVQYYVILSELIVVAYLAFNLLFLLMDLKASLLLLDQLHLLADRKVLTLPIFDMVRSEIHERVNASRWASDLIILPCILSVIFFVVLIVAIDEGLSENYMMTLIALMLSLFKEIFYLGIAFYYVSQVNEKADALTLKLSAQVWYPDNEYVHKADMQRVSIHASSVTNPVSFTLLYKRVSFRNVAVSVAGFSISVIVVLIKSIAGL